MCVGPYKATGAAGSRKRVALFTRLLISAGRMIRIDKLTKAFKGKPALRGISLQIERGEIYGLLGHNGAGKSTTFGIMLGQVYPDSGEVFIDGVSVQRHREKALARVGAIFESPGFYNYLSGWRNLQILTSYSARVPAADLR
jgi:ABC-2 type transport system ATP-binding protein